MNAKIAKIDSLIHQAEKVTFTDFNKCLELGVKAYQLAKEIDYPEGQADGLFFMGMAKYLLRDLDEALENLTQALAIYKALHDRQGEANCLLRIGATYSFKFSIDEAMDNLQKSLDIYKVIGDKVGQSSALGNIANIYDRQGYHDLALGYYLKVLKISQDSGDKRIEATTLLNIGTIYSIHSEFDKCLDYFLKSLQFFTQLQNKRMQSRTMNNIGSIYIELNQPENALRYLIPNRELRKEIGLKDEPYCLLNIGRAYKMQKDYEQAMAFFNRSKTLFKEYDNLEGHGLVHIFIGDIFSENDNLNQAISHYETAVNVLQKISYKNVLEEAYLRLAKAYEKKNNYCRAYQNLEKYNELITKRHEDETDKRFQQLKIRFEVERKEKETEMYRLKVDQQNKELALLAKNIKQKNKLLQELHKKISNMDKEDSLSKEELVASILSYLKKTNTGEGGWHIFEEQVDKIYPGFISYLCNNYPDLTRQELRVCALLRLDLSSKEIANTLFVATRTIEIYRTRIRKKLNLSHKTPLKLFLSAL